MVQSPPPARGSEPRSAGFTLLDTLLVVTIVGIVAAMAVQTLSNDELLVDATARSLAADLHEAQTVAIETRVPFGVRFQVDRNRTYFVLDDGSAPSASEAKLRALASLDAAGVERLLAAEAAGHRGLAPVRLTAGSFGTDDRVVFDPDGTPRATGYAEVTLGTAVLRIRVQATGRITITAP